MGSVILEIAPAAIFWALSPIIISVVILLLSTRKSIGNTIAFVLPSFLGSMLVGAVLIVLLDGYNYSKGSTASQLTYWAAIACGVVFFAAAVLIRWKVPKGSKEMKMPKWVQYLDQITPRKALLYGSILFVNNVFLTLTAVADVLRGQLSMAAGVLTIVSFVLVGTLGMWVPLAYKLVSPENSVAKIQGMREWLIINNRMILILEFLVLGAIELAKGIVGLI